MNLDFLQGHQRAALQFSGGKDSLALWYLLQPAIDNIIVYHLDTGDLFPEVHDLVQRVERRTPNFVRIDTSVEAWSAQFGLPTDLVPYSSTPGGVFFDQGVPLAPRYSCCWFNRMLPMHERMLQDGVTLAVRGTKLADRYGRQAARSGDGSLGYEMQFPLAGWTDERVLAFLQEQDLALPHLYGRWANAPECATCSAWWSEERADYLKEYYPELFVKYASRLRTISAAVAPVLDNLLREMQHTTMEA